MATDALITAHRKHSTALSLADEQRLKRSASIAAHLTKLAAMMAEPMDSGGVRLRLMAEDLSDLPTESVEYAIKAWRRGDTSHLSSYQQDHVRIGVFFPKPAELREIATVHLREQRQRDRDRERAEQDERDAQHRRQHPEQYVSMAEITAEVAERKKLSLLQAEQKPGAKCPRCGESLPVQPLSATGLALLSPADLRLMADVVERSRGKFEREETDGND